MASFYDSNLNELLDNYGVYGDNAIALLNFSAQNNLLPDYFAALGNFYFYDLNRKTPQEKK